MTIHRLSLSVLLHHNDCRDALRSLADNSVDSIVTDPPYALTAASRNGSPRNNDPETPFGRTKLGERGFMGKTWDTGEVAFSVEFWSECFRVLKPGGHVAAFSGTRTQHRMVCAIEDAGFEIRDQIYWHYGVGFPKSQNVSKFIDAALGVEGKKIATGAAVKRMIPGNDQNADGWVKDDGREFVPHEYAPATPQAQEFEGFGTALKPATEPVCLARKPLSEPTVAANVLRWRTGALNIGACRVQTSDNLNGGAYTPRAQGNAWESTGGMNKAGAVAATPFVQPEGRWPANVVTDGSPEVVAMFPRAKGAVSNGRKGVDGACFGHYEAMSQKPGRGDDGSAARFFYSAKASKQDRNGSKHPTVKPIALMEWLATLITPPGGTVLDPFAGSGTTGIAAANKGFRAILCEREAEYVADIRARFGPVAPDFSRLRRALANEAAARDAVADLQARYAS